MSNFLTRYSQNYYLRKALAGAGRVAKVARNLRTVNLKPEGPCRGRVLLSYIIDGFVTSQNDLNATHPAYWHTNALEAREMARVFLDLGFEVDAISFLNRSFEPKGHYDILVDSRHNLQRLSDSVGPNCLRIMHIDHAHLSFLNAAECRRLLELQQRRGITLPNRRWEPQNLGIEHSDCATILGNEWTMSTFRFANKPLYPLPIPSSRSYPRFDRDWSQCANKYLWLGSAGLVHKGLDLVLEAFACMPDFQLYVCGPVRQEPDFEAAFHRELYELPNIRTVGWTDTASPEFTALTQQCAGLIYPSCSEGQSGAVVTCMHAGLIPLVSVESGVDVDNFGRLLLTSSVSEIQDVIRANAARPAAELEAMSRAAWETARAKYTRENYGRVYRNIIRGLLSAAETADLTAPHTSQVQVH